MTTVFQRNYYWYLWCFSLQLIRQTTWAYLSYTGLHLRRQSLQQSVIMTLIQLHKNFISYIQPFKSLIRIKYIGIDYTYLMSKNKQEELSTAQYMYFFFFMIHRAGNWPMCSTPGVVLPPMTFQRRIHSYTLRSTDEGCTSKGKNISLEQTPCTEAHREWQI